MEHPESHPADDRDDDLAIDEEWAEEGWSPDNECPECGYADGRHRLEPTPCPNA